jgi:uncharacterized protein DUF3192
MVIRKLLLSSSIFLLAVVSGCGLIGEKHSALRNIRKTNRQVIAQKIKIGMTEKEVRGLFAGYAEVTEFMGPHIVCSNPYRSTAKYYNDDTILTLFYYTDLKRNDGIITRDEETWVLLKNGKVTGWGQWGK